MKLKSIADFISWEIKKKMIHLQDIFDKLIWKPYQKIDLDTFLNRHAVIPDFYFIQIGANDGVTGDKINGYIKNFHWKGILVEPVPYIFNRLIENYNQTNGLIFENSAIGKTNGYLPFYSIAEKNSLGVSHKELLSGFGLDQLGSFNKEVLLKHSGMIPDFESFVCEIKVPTITFNELVIKHNVSKINLLQVDTEGYDYDILINTDFSKIRPELLIFEHQHMTRLQYKKLIKRIRSLDYSFYINGWDTIGILNMKN